MSWETTDVLSADTTDVLSADTTDVLSADTTDVLSADTKNPCASETTLPQVFIPGRTLCVRGNAPAEVSFPGKNPCASEATLPQGLFFPGKSGLRFRQRSRKVSLYAKNGSPFMNLQGLGREWEPYYECQGFGVPSPGVP